MRRRLIGRRTRRVPPGMNLSNQRMAGRITRRTVRIGRMQQFPSVAQVKFVAEAQALFQMTIVDSTRSKPIRLLPVGPFSVSGDEWNGLGTASFAPTYAPGWATWMNAYARYRVKGVKVELFPLVRTGDYSKQCILMLKVYAADNSSISSLIGTPQTWVTDPTVKRATLEPSGNGILQANSPALIEYVKPYDIWKRNQDWSTTEATMTAFPTRYMRAQVALLRISADANTIDWGIRCRMTFYTELFDRKSQMDSTITPPEELAAILAKGPMEDAVIPLPEFVVDSKVAV